MILAKNALAIVGTCGLAMALSGCNGALLQAIADNEDPTPVHAYNAAGPLLPNANPLTTATVSRTNEGQGVGVETLVVDVDGQHYELPKVDVPGYEFYADSANAADATLVAEQISLQYSSLVFLLDISDAQVASFEDIDLGADGTGFGPLALIASGTVETPVGSLPAQIVNYQGEYVLIFTQDGMNVPGGGQAGNFTAVADFNNSTINIELDFGDTLPATIVGNRFGGTFGQDTEFVTMTGELAGGFYGPGAEEIVGIAGGTAIYKDTSETIDFTAGLLGQQVAP